MTEYYYQTIRKLSESDELMDINSIAKYHKTLNESIFRLILVGQNRYLMKHYNINISGRVQGIGYRNSVKHQARYLGIKGFVKNQPEGSVYIEAEGNSIALAEFVKWCKNGHPVASVEEISITEGEAIYYPSFEARY